MKLFLISIFFSLSFVAFGQGQVKGNNTASVNGKQVVTNDSSSVRRQNLVPVENNGDLIVAPNIITPAAKQTRQSNQVPNSAKGDMGTSVAPTDPSVRTQNRVTNTNNNQDIQVAPKE